MSIKCPAKKEGEKPKKIGETIYTAGVTAVTYLGETAGNTLEDILTMSFGTNWKEIESEMDCACIRGHTKNHILI